MAGCWHFRPVDTCTWLQITVTRHIFPTFSRVQIVPPFKVHTCQSLSFKTKICSDLFHCFETFSLQTRVRLQIGHPKCPWSIIIFPIQLTIKNTSCCMALLETNLTRSYIYIDACISAHLHIMIYIYIHTKIVQQYTSSWLASYVSYLFV